MARQSASDSMWDEEQSRLFGLFVRTRRESISPAGGKRHKRTPGLRREELAHRANISAGWCASIEQGRTAGISAGVLHRLAVALELSEDEKAAFFELAGRGTEVEPPLPATAGWSADIPDETARDIADVANPAFALDGLWNAVCWNKRAERLFPDWLGEECDRNLLRYAFLNKEARRLFEPWLAWAHGVAADFRSAIAGQPETVRTRDLIESLSQASATFAAAWSAGPGASPRRSLWAMRGADRAPQCFMVSRMGPRSEGGCQPLVLLPFEAHAHPRQGLEPVGVLAAGPA